MRGQKYRLPKPTNPKTSYSEAKDLFELQGKLGQFKRFARNTKNLFIRERLFFRQHGLCPFCNKPLPYYIMEVCIHHLDYKHCCILCDDDIRVYTPSIRGRSSAKVPNCEICYFYFPTESEECLSKLVLMHRVCHEKLHGVDQNTTKKRITA